MNYIDLIEGANGAWHSTTYGVNGRSPLMQLTHFGITKCLPFDIMHTIFEGVVKYHLNQVLHHLIDECSYITLEQLKQHDHDTPLWLFRGWHKANTDSQTIKFNIRFSFQIVRYMMCYVDMD